MDDPSSGDPVSGRENNTPIPPTSQQIHEAEQFSPRQISPIAELEQEQSHASEHDQPSSAFAATTATHQSSPPPSADPPQGGTSTPTLGSDDDIPVVGTFDELSNSTEYAMNLTGGIGDDAFSNYSDEDGEDDDDRDGTYTDGTPEQQSLFVRDNSSEDVPTRKLASFKRPRTTNHKNQSSPANKRRKIPKHQQPSQAPDNSLNQAESTDDPGLVRSLLSSNIFNDIDASKGEDHEPVIVADNIPRALQQLLKLAKTEEEKKQVKRFGQNIKFIQRRIHVKELTQWRVNGMLSYLKAFQVDGVAEMLRREEQREPPRGGVFRLSNRSREDGAHDQ